MGQNELRKRVLDQNLCAGCGACVNLCPYLAIYKDKTIILDNCNREEGKCYMFCPRTPTDLDILRQSLFDINDLTEELGPVKAFYTARAVDEKMRNLAQHGATVTTLITLALQEGIIDNAIVTEDREDFLPYTTVAKNKPEILKGAKSKFVISPTVAVFNKFSKSGDQNVGVVATPCQALAFAKMRLKSFSSQDSNIGKLKLVIGLFCGWALSWEKLKLVLQEKVPKDSIMGMDIPPSKYHSMEIYTKDRTIEISLEEIMPCVKEACNYCFDMTAEFSDISVGSARCPEGWEVAKGWNQVIVRSQIGQELMQIAKSKALLEFRDVPEKYLEKLKKASLNKKRNALKNIIHKSNDRKDLIYLNCNDSIFSKILA